MHVRCDRCQGKKKLIGLGAMAKECEHCKGVGYVSIKDAVKKDVDIKVKRGRKPRIKEDEQV